MEAIFVSAFADELTKLAKKDDRDDTEKAIRRGAGTGAAILGASGALEGRRKGVAFGERVSKESMGNQFGNRGIKRTSRGFRVDIKGSPPLTAAQRAKVKKISRWGGGAVGGAGGAMKGVAKGALLGGALGYLLRTRKKKQEERRKKSKKD